MNKADDLNKKIETLSEAQIEYLVNLIDLLFGKAAN